MMRPTVSAWVLLLVDIATSEYTRTLLIDAGSGGSRLHVYKWSPPDYGINPDKIIYPSTDESWTAVIQPGIATFGDSLDKVDEQLHELIRDTMRRLYAEKKLWNTYKFYFKATGGMRQIPVQSRESIMDRVRSLLSNKTFCPFYFEPEYARVISGEEEAVFSWIATNYLMGTLENIEGKGESFFNQTYGTLDLGGASAQIAFFVPSQDISENMFRAQLGGQKHWNLYAKSFLEFGHMAALHRHIVDIASRANFDEAEAVVPSSLTFCFHAGYSEYVSYPLPVGMRIEGQTNDVTVEVRGPAAPTWDQSARCRESLQPLMLKNIGSFCLWAHSGQCSIGDAYQPQLPPPGDDHAHFVGISSFRYAWEFLQLPTSSTLKQFKSKADYICSLSFRDVQQYFISKGFNAGGASEVRNYLPYFCIQSSYVLVLLLDGYGFTEQHTLSVLDELHGNKVSWTLGAVMFEINALQRDESPVVMYTAPVPSAYIAGLFIFGIMIGAGVVLLAQQFRCSSHAFPMMPPQQSIPTKASPGISERDKTMSWSKINRTNMPYRHVPSTA